MKIEVAGARKAAGHVLLACRATKYYYAALAKQQGGLGQRGVSHCMEGRCQASSNMQYKVLHTRSGGKPAGDSESPLPTESSHHWFVGLMQPGVSSSSNTFHEGMSTPLIPGMLPAVQ
mmetsp:Transcript_38058/g.80579  ORF Transcript_38058/g.80579 Transcript_38058/m.80579 type:complete len:118 (+) Transcript_38058:210-563(+)